jgi:hypothetical protein
VVVVDPEDPPDDPPEDDPLEPDEDPELPDPEDDPDPLDPEDDPDPLDPEDDPDPLDPEDDPDPLDPEDDPDPLPDDDPEDPPVPASPLIALLPLVEFSFDCPDAPASEFESFEFSDTPLYVPPYGPPSGVPVPLQPKANSEMASDVRTLRMGALYERGVASPPEVAANLERTTPNPTIFVPIPATSLSFDASISLVSTSDMCVSDRETDHAPR